MSNARSPREVCSTTIGINGLISPLLPTGGPKLRCGRRPFLPVRRPDALARLVQLGRDRPYLRRDAIEHLLHAEIVAHTVGAAALDELVDVLVGLACGPKLLADLVVGDVEPELVRDGLEHE